MGASGLVGGVGGKWVEIDESGWGWVKMSRCDCGSHLGWVGMELVESGWRSMKVGGDG